MLAFLLDQFNPFIFLFIFIFMNSLEYMHAMQCVHKFEKAGFQVLLYSHAFNRKKWWGGGNFEPLIYTLYILVPLIYTLCFRNKYISRRIKPVIKACSEKLKTLIIIGCSRYLMTLIMVLLSLMKTCLYLTCFNYIDQRQKDGNEDK